MMINENQISFHEAIIDHGLLFIHYVIRILKNPFAAKRHPPVIVRLRNRRFSSSGARLVARKNCCEPGLATIGISPANDIVCCRYVLMN